VDKTLREHLAADVTGGELAALIAEALIPHRIPQEIRHSLLPNQSHRISFIGDPPSFALDLIVRVDSEGRVWAEWRMNGNVLRVETW